MRLQPQLKVVEVVVHMVCSGGREGGSGVEVSVVLCCGLWT